MADTFFDDPSDGIGLDLNAQVGPFGASVNGALGLLPDATLLGQEPAPGGFERGVTRLQAFKWVQEFTGSVLLRLGGLERLYAEVPDAVPALFTQCRDLVQVGTAARIEGARGSDVYAGTLWAQYNAGKADLLAWLDATFGQEQQLDDSASSILFSFPCPTFPDSIRW